MSDVTSTSATTTPVTVDDVRTHLNLSSTQDDVYLDGLIRTATRYLEHRSSQCFINQTRTLKMDGFDDCRYVFGRAIRPPRGPLSSVSSIAYTNSTGGSSTVASSDYTVSADNPGRITEAYNATWPVPRRTANSVTVTYVAGHGSTQSSVPENVRHAVLMMTAHWYRMREPVLVGTISKEMEFGIDALMGSEHIEHYG